MLSISVGVNTVQSLKVYLPDNDVSCFQKLFIDVVKNVFKCEFVCGKCFNESITTFDAINYIYNSVYFVITITNYSKIYMIIFPEICG